MKQSLLYQDYIEMGRREAVNRWKANATKETVVCWIEEIWFGVGRTGNLC